MYFIIYISQNSNKPGYLEAAIPEVWKSGILTVNNNDSWQSYNKKEIKVLKSSGRSMEGVSTGAIWWGKASRGS